MEDMVNANACLPFTRWEVKLITDGVVSSSWFNFHIGNPLASSGDFDGDGIVNINDLMYLFSLNWHVLCE